ncbi:ketopantoate reductase family protein [Chromohalobacter sp. 48-RD10]|uniref:ketopantoate reductase family protein n=1 Tax=Chromohalobacter sp. 48-RD10 TaxID=2994063 RepID=UPI0024696229|nr:ketopantoate reductase family protein [Chromohalobacter sp. 48-RD10]
MRTSPTWWILGAGALGRLFGARLTTTLSLHLIGRRPDDGPLRYHAPCGEIHDVDVARTTLATLALHTHARPALVVLATKSYATLTAVEELAGHVDPQTPLLSLQNGFSIQPRLAKIWAGPVLCASTTEGAYVEGETGVVHAGTGTTWIGDIDNTWPILARDSVYWLNQAGFSAYHDVAIVQRLWHKLAINAAINPLVARYRIRNGQLRDQPFRRMVDSIINEIGPLLEGEGVVPPPAGWHTLVWEVIGATANNRASMLQDVLAGRPTEREAILGPLLAIAKRQRCTAPTLETLYHDTPS